jgi:hypothetical protein
LVAGLSRLLGLDPPHFRDPLLAYLARRVFDADVALDLEPDPVQGPVIFEDPDA